MKTYILHHKHAIKTTYNQFKSSWFASLMTILVIAITLVFPMMLWLMVKNVEPIVEKWQGDPKASIYLKQNGKLENVQNLLAELKSIDFVTDAELIDETQALQLFEQSAGLSDVLGVLQDNPLPASIVLSLDTSVSADEIELTLEKYSQHLEVDEIRFDLQWVKRLQAIVQVVKKILWLVILLVLAAAMLVISNTIRLIIANRKTEIEILNSVGATNIFVARPFLYSGFIKGLLASSLGFMIVYMAMLWLYPSLQNLLNLYFSKQAFTVFSPSLILYAILTVSALGWLSSLITVKIFLMKYQPK